MAMRRHWRLLHEIGGSAPDRPINVVAWPRAAWDAASPKTAARSAGTSCLPSFLVPLLQDCRLCSFDRIAGCQEAFHPALTATRVIGASQEHQARLGCESVIPDLQRA